MKYDNFTYGELLELIDYCTSQCPEKMNYPYIGNSIRETYHGATKTTYPPKGDDDVLTSVEMLRLKFFGLDELLVDWRRWYGLNKLITSV
jgi:hypothetical protein